MQKLILIFCFLFVSFCSFSQGTIINLNTDSYRYIERLDVKYGKIIPIEHTGDKPFFRGNAAKLAETLLLSNLRFNKIQQFQLQYLIDENGEWLDSLQSRTKRPLFKVLYREPASFAHVSSKKRGLWDIRFNPVIDLKVGVESNGSRFLFQRVLGLEVRGNIKRVFSFYFNVYGNSARNPEYVFDKAQKKNDSSYVYIPGQSYYKVYSSKIFKFNDGVDYFDARGYINLHVLKHINISFGRDKFFIGNGQRSMMLSDYSAPYLFLKFNLNIWRFNYNSIIAELNSQYFRGGDKLLPKKYMAIHHLSVQASPHFNFGLFEGAILQRSNHFEIQYLNPIIFYRAVEHAIGSPDNVLIGADFKANMIKHLQLYGQFVLDEFNFKQAFARKGWWANKWGLQMGIKYIDIAPGLDAQLEFNMARPFTYAHSGAVNYTHYNQPLAHPLGANFYEVLVNLRYQPIPRLFLNAKFLVAKVGEDTVDAATGTLTNYGSDILRSTSYRSLAGNADKDLGHKMLDGAKGTLTYFQLLATYQAWHNIYIDAELTYRGKTSIKSLNNPVYTGSTFMFSIGARMNLPYRSFDF